MMISVGGLGLTVVIVFKFMSFVDDCGEAFAGAGGGDGNRLSNGCVGGWIGESIAMAGDSLGLESVLDLCGGRKPLRRTLGDARIVIPKKRSKLTILSEFV